MEEQKTMGAMTEEEKYRYAKKRVEELKGFYSHLISYAAVQCCAYAYLVFYYRQNRRISMVFLGAWLVGLWAFLACNGFICFQQDGKRQLGTAKSQGNHGQDGSGQ